MAIRKYLRTPALTTIGVRPADSKIHEYGRVIVVMLLLALAAWEIYSETQMMDDLEELEVVIKPDSILYNAILELDPDSQVKYIKHIKSTLMCSNEGMLRRYYKNIGIALVAGICSEYIINGSLDKPLGGVAKTIIYATMITSLQ
jgi:hypothetical protein